METGGFAVKQRIGKSVIEITVEGCIRCGTRWSSGWEVARRVPVKIGNSEGTVSLHICADCMKKKQQETYQPLLMEDV
jgi:hypothetical protein